MSAQMMNLWEFLGGSVVRTWCFQCQGLGLIHGWGSKSPQVSWYSKKKSGPRISEIPPFHKNTGKNCQNQMFQKHKN